MTMTKEEIRQHWSEVVRAVFAAEDAVRPTLNERRSALGENPTKEQRDALADEWCLAVADEILSKTSEEELKKAYLS